MTSTAPAPAPWRCLNTAHFTSVIRQEQASTVGRLNRSIDWKRTAECSMRAARIAPLALLLSSSCAAPVTLGPCPSSFVVSAPEVSILSADVAPVPVVPGQWVSARFTMQFDSWSAATSVSQSFIAFEPLLFGSVYETKLYPICEVVPCPVQLGVMTGGTLWYKVVSVPWSVAQGIGSIEVQARVVSTGISPVPPGAGCVKTTVAVAQFTPGPPPPAPLVECALSPCARPYYPSYSADFCSHASGEYVPNAADCDGDGKADHLCFDRSIRGTYADSEFVGGFSFVASTDPAMCNNADPPIIPSRPLFLYGETCTRNCTSLPPSPPSASPFPPSAGPGTTASPSVSLPSQPTLPPFVATPPVLPPLPLLSPQSLKPYLDTDDGLVIASSFGVAISTIVCICTLCVVWMRARRLQQRHLDAYLSAQATQAQRPIHARAQPQACKAGSGTIEMASAASVGPIEARPPSLLAGATSTIIELAVDEISPIPTPDIGTRTVGFVEAGGAPATGAEVDNFSPEITSVSDGEDQAPWESQAVQNRWGKVRSLSLRNLAQGWVNFERRTSGSL